MRNPSLRVGLLALAVGATVGLTACAGGAGTAAPAASAPAETGTRVALSYPGGIVVLDGASLDTLGDVASEQFTRLNSAGDGRHVMVTTSEGFQVLDAGAADAAPELTDLVFPASKPGHVVTHGGKTVLYADGTSDSTVFDSDALLASTDSLPSVETIPGVEAHHGVSIVLEDGTFLTTVGNADGRNGVVAKDASGATLAQSSECPGVHGEGTAEDEIVVFGCENGALIYESGAFTKLTAPDQPYGRMGNAYVSEDSPLIVGDYKDDPDAEGYLLHRVALIDTAAKTQRVVDLPEGVEYTFRDIARGPAGLAYILATDGAIHVLDPATGDLTASYPVIGAWEGPAEWQDAHPAIKISGDIAYVTEPAKNAVHAVDLTSGEVVKSVTLDATPNEIALTK
jgi:hypothetical protein